jgi:hypothetical protein
LFISDQLAFFYSVKRLRPMCGRSQCEKSANRANFPAKTGAPAA